MVFFLRGQGEGGCEFSSFFMPQKNYFFFVFKEGWTLTLSLSFYRLRVVKNHGRKKDRGGVAFFQGSATPTNYIRETFTHFVHIFTRIYTPFFKWGFIFQEKAGLK